jgi:hypothetical protein
VKTGRRDALALCGMLARWQALPLEMDRQIAALTALIEAADAGERPAGAGAPTAGTLDREAGDWRRFLRFQPGCHAVKRLGPALQEARLRGQPARRRKLIVALARRH